MEYVFVAVGGFLVGWNAARLWCNGYNHSRVAFAFLGLLLAAYGVFR